MQIEKRTFIKILVLTSFALMSTPTYSLAPEGLPDSIELELIEELTYAMRSNTRSDDSEFTKKIKTFLFENRDALIMDNIDDSRVVESAMCVLMHKYDYVGFQQYLGESPIHQWCDRIMR